MRLAAQIARLANKKTSTEVLIVFCLRKRTERFFFSNGRRFKVFLEIWDNIAGCKFIIFFIQVEMRAGQTVET